MATLLKIGASRLSPVHLLTRGRQVLASLTTNPDFPDVQPTLPDLETALASLELSIREAAFGDRMHIMAMHQASKLVVTHLRYLAAAVERTAAGNLELLIRTGFELRKRGSARTVSTAPEGLNNVLTEEVGVIPLRWKPVAGARLYEVQQCEGSPELESNWTNLATTPAGSCRVVVEKSAHYYWYRVRALGRTGAGPWSDPITAMAQ